MTNSVWSRLTHVRRILDIESRKADDGMVLDDAAAPSITLVKNAVSPLAAAAAEAAATASGSAQSEQSSSSGSTQLSIIIAVSILSGALGVFLITYLIIWCKRRKRRQRGDIPSKESRGCLGRRRRRLKKFEMSQNPIPPVGKQEDYGMDWDPEATFAKPFKTRTVRRASADTESSSLFRRIMNGNNSPTTENRPNRIPKLRFRNPLPSWYSSPRREYGNGLYSTGENTSSRSVLLDQNTPLPDEPPKAKCNKKPLRVVTRFSRTSSIFHLDRHSTISPRQSRTPKTPKTPQTPRTPREVFLYSPSTYKAPTPKGANTHHNKHSNDENDTYYTLNNNTNPSKRTSTNNTKDQNSRQHARAISKFSWSTPTTHVSPTDSTSGFTFLGHPPSSGTMAGIRFDENETGTIRTTRTEDSLPRFRTTSSWVLHQQQKAMIRNNGLHIVPDSDDTTGVNPATTTTTGPVGVVRSAEDGAASARDSSGSKMSLPLQTFYEGSR